MCERLPTLIFALSGAIFLLASNDEADLLIEYEERVKML
jgi:hypothetical protein